MGSFRQPSERRRRVENSGVGGDGGGTLARTLAHSCLRARGRTVHKQARARAPRSHQAGPQSAGA
eukprot:14335856-Alexandrium_andersonii.AAC.1